MLLLFLFNIVPLLLIPSGVVATTFRMRNECNYTVWPAIAPPLSTTTGFSLRIGESRTIDAPASWNGRIWGRTYCTSTQNLTTKFSCITGDCGSGKPDCSGRGSGAPPVTLAEFNLGNGDGVDFFDVSLVDGYNLPVLVVPTRNNCKRAGCILDLNGVCPSKLKVTGADGKTIACKSACNAFGSSQYCCNGTHGTPETCKPSSYSRTFKISCPDTHVSVVNDDNTTFTCASSDYQIIFCGFLNHWFDSSNVTVISSNNSEPSSGGTTLGFASAGLVIICLVVVLVLGIRRWKKSKTIDEGDVEGDHITQVPGMPVRFSFKDLHVATNDFKERLGRGGFGSVFKGVLADGTEIAVKRLKILRNGKSAFLAEVETIGSLHHFNLVRLIGFCEEKSHMFLVYEYMSNGSLDKWIFKKDQGSYLDWDTRKKITLDIAKGLAYLHEDCRQTILHLDIKPQNILLDPNFNAKISDFGLSKLVDRDMSQVELSMRGTPGYLAPEWRQPLGRITVKVDTYSFGIVVLEIVCTRRNADRSQPESAFLLLGMLQKKAEQDRLMDIVENLDEYNQSQREEIIRMIKIGAWCLQDEPERRPLMSTVVKVLEGVMEVESNLIYKFSHPLISSAVVHNHISSALQPASVLSNPR